MDQIDSADHDEEGLSLEFDSIFADVDLLDNPTIYTPSKHLNEIEGNISSENVELGSSCGSNIDQQPLTMINNQGAISSTEKENLTAVSGFTSTNELSGRPPLENDPNMAPLLMGTPSLLDYSKDIINSELGAISSADRGQVHNIDAHSSGCEKINSGPRIVNVNNIVNGPNLQQLGTISSFNAVPPGSPQHCPSLLDYAEFSWSAGTNWSDNINVNHANLINNQNLNMQPSMNPSSSSSFQFQSSHYPSIGMSGRNTRSPCLNATVPVQQLTNRMGIPTAQVNGVVQSFHQESHHDPANMIYSYQYPNPNAYPENVPQVLEQHIPL
ncbi:hypothetical protein PanWU01x14_139920 [Parasponia andersonii]|uniref:Uncharacterized protein n=1 Tax=Parasponia andersonii TaxID=3476 RepID=A0A2P5CMN3_PARAD|nr:hypothetical protein PanWU01x14_139920 [Parasponia andersonii]